MELVHNEVTDQILGAAVEVHRALGPGLLESTYRACLVRALCDRGMEVRTEVPIPVHFRGVKLDCGYRADLVVNDAVIVELKAVDQLGPLHDAQLLTYLKHTGIRVGLLLNFNTPLLRDGIRRRVL